MTEVITNSMIQLFRIHYLKIVNVNLSDETYRVIWLRDSAAPDKLIFNFNMFKNQIKIEQSVHPDDVDSLKRYCDKEFVSNIIEDNHIIRIKFRAIQPDSSYKWQELEIVPGLDYTSTNCSLILYYRDIDSDYARDYEARRRMEEACSKDHLTEFNNRYSFDKFISSSANASSVGLLYLDLNRLKYVNDTQGHSAGDRYIKYFCSLLTQVFRINDCYRIGGDEFVVAILNIDKATFEEKVNQFSEFNTMSELTYPISSIGTYWSDSRPFNILKMLDAAEKRMYIDKNHIHTLMLNQN